ncbi:non-hydrolyzing UDP-N-acetylglucosamine 2-epimerase [Phyllobacterium leguminum]|uniref:UDP-N-acetylglucosamine 2-epimerase (non-hydrolyzing) n=1 Tax=Phyllobacterium leguminum TaxID=314237 RepID=A0A318T6H1_9HYPH|nr:UDP-N-acetylglucosamine 2-epimerase (non-hydrolyzing) [Phyllobacterium leguminum]PYE90004.1 UDP-N-acetylglucosamine 2-epimerase [Phyllobacterium leguminum]
MHVLSVFGTRPEAIKMAPVVKALSAEKGIRSITCVTGQHRTMLDQVLALFDIKPDFDLAVMAPNQTLNGLASRVMAGLDDIFAEVRPDYVLVHGDTTTAMAASLAAAHRNIKIGHVEAGLRTYDLAKPWPEELNRRVIDVAATKLFAPTETSADNLRAERLGGEILVTGNTVIDALKETVGRIDNDPAIRTRLEAQFSFLDPSRRVLLVTGHRRESFGDGFLNICKALAELSRRADLQIVYPVHLNPNVSGPVHELLSGKPNIHLIEPQEYLSFVYLMNRADIILTDSGGVQEEAPSLGKPVLVMRDVTERPEAVAAGVVRLVGTDAQRITGEVERLLGDAAYYSGFARILNPYGDGLASKRIAASLAGRDIAPFAI